jgi:hypothetical protein
MWRTKCRKQVWPYLLWWVVQQPNCIRLSRSLLITTIRWSMCSMRRRIRWSQLSCWIRIPVMRISKTWIMNMKPCVLPWKRKRKCWFHWAKLVPILSR